ncbi:MAG: hypothetical protein WCN88_04065 [Candidatus Falkowbacteria bacterium]
MALDDQLINRSETQEKKADDSESNASDSGYNDDEDAADRAGNLRMAQKGGGASESSGDFRADQMTEKRKQGLKAKTNKMITAALAPARKGTSALLKAAWENLIETFGLTLIWIDIHVFLNLVLGDKLFCKLGEEWIPDKPGAPGSGK